MSHVLERAGSWDVDNEFVLPRLDDVVDRADVSQFSTETTDRYFDTADADLQAHGIVLRHRSGAQSGWQLMIPGETRSELTADSSETPPRGMLDLLTGIRLGKPVVEVATIRTSRDQYQITSAVDGARVEVEDDRVRASAGQHQLLAWREIDVDLSAGINSLPKKLARRLSKAGATPARHESKLARLNRIHASAASSATKSAHETALGDYVATQIDAIFAGDIGLRRGQDPIHDTRVAIRRLRSTLRVFAKLLDDNATHTEEELKWFAALLGEVRDCQVQRNRFLHTLDQLPPELVLGPVAARITTDLRGTELPARQVVADAMDSDRYLSLLATLAQWRSEPPVTGGVGAKTIDKRAKRAYTKADRRLTEALQADQDELLHRARKAAKRARYAAELQQPAKPKAKRTVKSHKRVQRVLGDFQDGAVALPILRRLGAAAGTTDGENGFTFGLLYEREQTLMRNARNAAHTLLSANS